MALTYFNPAWLLMIAGILIPVHFRLRSMLGLAYVVISILTLIWVILLPNGEYLQGYSLLDHDLIIFKITKTSKMFAIAFALMLVMSTIYTMDNAKPLEVSSAMFSAGSAIGVVFSGDLITLSLYWQLIAVSSTLLLWSKRSVESRKSAKKYLLLHLCGGFVMFMGVILFSQAPNAIEITDLAEYVYSGDCGAILILIGTLLSAGCPPFTRWISETYTVASPSGSVFLSGFMTKSAIYVLLILFAGLHFLIYLGLLMIIYGVVYSLLCADQRKALSYLIVNQAGFMVVCIGLGSEISANAVCIMAFANIIYSALLYMGMGLVARSSKNEQAINMGIFRFMPFEFICTLIGGLGISMFPLTSGFISKALLLSALNELGIQWVYILVLAGTAGVFASVVVRFIYGVIHAPLEKDLKTIKTPLNIKIAMGLMALVTLVVGIFPKYFYSFLPYDMDVNYKAYNYHSVVEILELLAFAGFIFVFVLKSTKLFSSKEDHEILDFDWIWAKGLLTIIALIITIYENISRYINRRIIQNIHKILDTILTNVAKPHVSGSVWNAKITAVIPIAMILVMLIFFLFTHKI